MNKLAVVAITAILSGCSVVDLPDPVYQNEMANAVVVGCKYLCTGMIFGGLFIGMGGSR